MEFIRDIKPFFYRRKLVYVDVGAFRGTVFRDLVAAGLSIREAHLIEPNPATFEALRSAVDAIGSVQLRYCHNLALGDAVGRLRLRAAGSMTKAVAPAPALAPAPAGDPAVAGDLALDIAPPGENEFEIAMTTLDELAETFERRHVSILKIDVEGFEPKVLAGAERLLRDQAIDVIYVEGGMDAKGRQQSYYRAIEDQLGGFGYRLFRIYEQAHEWLDDSPLLRRLDMAFMSKAFADANPYRLTQELVELQEGQAALKSRLAAAEAEAAAARKEAAEARKRISELASYGEKLERQHQAVLASRAWRATAPMRGVVDRLAGRKGAKPFAPKLLSAEAGPPAGGGARRSSWWVFDRIADRVHSGASVAAGGEFIPFEIVKPATRAAAADPDARFVFAITLASEATVPDWEHTKRLLEATLRSVIAQSDPDWTAIVAGHELPDIPEMADERIEFVRVDRRRPSDRSQFRADKSAKRHVLGRRLAQMGGGYFMQLDADDLVRDDLVATVLGARYQSGAVSAKGYALDFINRRLAPVPGAWQHDLHNVCGSCSVVRYAEADLPTRTHQSNDPTLVFNMTRQHAYTSVVMEELGRPLTFFDEPMVVYLVNHAQSLSFSMQKSGSRGANIVEAVARHALEPAEAAAVLRRFGIADWS